MIDVVALGELLIDFATISTDADGYPTMAAHPGGAPANFLAALTKYGFGTALLGTVTPKLGEKAAHNSNVVYSLDFDVTPHLLRHTYITNLIYASVDPKTVQYLAGHENSKITMDIYAKVKYNKPEQVVAVVNDAFRRSA